MTGLQRAERLAEWAGALIESDHEATAGLWPQASALLARRALKEALSHLWATRSPGMSECSYRSQLLCLPNFIDDTVARRAAYTHNALSQACHRRAYELPPTAGELKAWIETVADLNVAVQAVSGMNASASGVGSAESVV